MPIRKSDTTVKKNRYKSYSELAATQSLNVDYRISVFERSGSTTAIVAPHGGKIESNTSEVAHLIAGDDFNLYLFEGIRESCNYEALHLTSHCFDEPQCLELIKDKQTVVTIHGCSEAQPIVFIGGLDQRLISSMAKSLLNENIPTLTKNHRFLGQHKNNICNRGKNGKGVQIELSDPLRNTSMRHQVCDVIRQTLIESEKEEMS